MTEIAQYSIELAGGDPRCCYSPTDVMRQSRSHHDCHRMIIGWFEGDVDDAPRNAEGIPLLAVAEEGIGVYSEYAAPFPVPDTIVPGGEVTGELTAYATVGASLTSHLSQVTVCAFPLDIPEGVADVLLAEAERLALSWGRTDGALFLDDIRGDDVPCEASSMSVASTSLNRAARDRGWQLTQVERCSAAPVPSRQWLAEHGDVTNGDYRLETFIDVIPDDLLPSLIRVANRMGTDAPTAGFEAEELGITEEKWRQGEQFLIQDGTETILTLALRNDEVVGYTELVIEPGRPVGQGDTIVDRDHRGHGLGLAMKVRNLEVLRQRHPHEERVLTWNAVENGPMLRINDLLGFEVLNVGGQWQKKLG